MEKGFAQSIHINVKLRIKVNFSDVIHIWVCVLPWVMGLILILLFLFCIILWQFFDFSAKYDEWFEFKRMISIEFIFILSRTLPTYRVNWKAIYETNCNSLKAVKINQTIDWVIKSIVVLPYAINWMRSLAWCRFKRFAFSQYYSIGCSTYPYEMSVCKYLVSWKKKKNWNKNKISLFVIESRVSLNLCFYFSR